MSRRAGLFVALCAAFVTLSCDEPVPFTVTPSDPLDPAVRPKVISTYPPNGGVGPYELCLPWEQNRPHFILQFSKLIDSSKFEPHWLQIEGFQSPVRIRRYDPSSLTDILGITLIDSTTGDRSVYGVGRTYTVTVHTTLYDANGTHPYQPYRFSFTPEPHFRIVDVRYERGEPLSSDDTIWLHFNAEPAPAISARIHFDPFVLGVWGGSGYIRRFSSHQPFQFGTSYLLHVEQSTADTHGNRLAQPFQRTFQVRPFELLFTTPRNGVTDVWPSNRGVFVGASGPIDTTSLAGAFRIEPPLPGRLEGHGNGFLFESATDFQSSTTYRVEILPTLRARDGSGLARGHAFTFTTEAFRAVRVYPDEYYPPMPLDTEVVIDFNMTLDPLTIQPAFSIDPPVPGNLGGNADEIRFTPAQLLEPDRQYTVTISTSLRAATGAELAAPVTVSFRTAAP